jgi:hypothetical protein
LPRWRRAAAPRQRCRGARRSRRPGGGFYDKTTAATDLPQRSFHGQLLVDTRLTARISGAVKWETYLSITNLFNQMVNPYVVNVQNDFDTIGRTYRVGVRFTY